VPASARRRAERDDDTHGRALAQFTFQPDLAAHERKQTPADREAEPGAAITPGGGGVSLGEGFEYLLLFLGRNADAGILYPKFEVHPILLDPLGWRLTA
jgi:hypothetical protein